MCNLDKRYKVCSNRESDDGRYDIALFPCKESFLGILIEIKSLKKCSSKRLKEVAKSVLQQINDKNYVTEFENLGVTSVLYYGVAFSRKKVEIENESGSLF